MENLRKSVLSLSLSIISLFGMTSCSRKPGISSKETPEPSSEKNSDQKTSNSEKPLTYSHELKDQVKEWVRKSNAKFSVEYYTASAVYCSKPTHASQQSLTLYAPKEYFNSDGTLNPNGTLNGFTAKSAPIIYWNSHGSYIGQAPFALVGNSTRATQNGWVAELLKKGFVICMVGERGKQSKNEQGEVIGRGLVAISDLKAGVRFLRHNKAVLPGNVERIISVGTSSGGSMSALLGTSGNVHHYDDLLQEMGAVMDERDDVYATQAYCPITDLDHADYAYEWLYHTDNAAMTDFEKALSQKMVLKYASYVNSLNLTDGDVSLRLSEDGRKEGTYFTYLEKKYEEAFSDYAENFLSDYCKIATNARNGASDADDLDWIDYDPQTGESHLVTVEGYDNPIDSMIKTGFVHRMKTCVPVFDRKAMIGSDNEIFGKQNTKPNSEDSVRHFNPEIADMIQDLEKDYPEEYGKYYQDYYSDSHDEEVMYWTKYINATTYLTEDDSSTISPHFRICMGVEDTDTSCLVSSTLDLLLKKKGIDSTFSLLWGWRHNDVDTPHGLYDFVMSIL